MAALYRRWPAPALALVPALALAVGMPALGAEQTLYGLPCYPGPSQAFAGVAIGKSGDVFGATFAGGSTNSGAAFELLPPAGTGGSWTAQTLYSFGMNTAPPATDATNPQATMLMEKNGTLIGTGYYSADFGCGGSGCGAIYTLSPPAAGGTVWTEQVRYDFAGGTDGANPVAGLIADSSGNFYGTTQNGGAGGAGTVFEISPPAGGGTAWTETPLYSFSNGADGGLPVAPLVLDARGALYGTTPYGGSGSGTVFRLNPPAVAGGAWSESVLYVFGASGAGNDGNQPQGPVVFDASGALYGTTLRGGASGLGAVYKLTPPGSGQTAWTETTLYSFADSGDGALPSGALLLKGKTLYGAAQGSGRAKSNGTVFKLSPGAHGGVPWKVQILYAFSGGADGQYPLSGVAMDKKGNLYGTTLRGGPKACGAVFEVSK